MKKVTSAVLTADDALNCTNRPMCPSHCNKPDINPGPVEMKINYPCGLLLDALTSKHDNMRTENVYGRVVYQFMIYLFISSGFLHTC